MIIKKDQLLASFQTTLHITHQFGYVTVLLTLPPKYSRTVYVEVEL